MADPITALAAPLMPFLDYLRPNKSPYVLVSVAILACLLLPDNALFENPFGWMYHVPIYLVIACTVVLSFLYRPPEIGKLGPSASGLSDAGQDISEETTIEMDHQLKFSRSFCLICGIASLYILFKSDSRAIIELFIILYLAIVFHIALFMGYLLFRSLREESINKFAVFQIGFITGISLLGTSLSYDQIKKDDHSVLINCSQRYLLDTDNNENIEKFESEGLWPVDFENLDFPRTEAFDNNCATQDTMYFSDYVYKIDPEGLTRKFDWKASNTVIFAIAWFAFVSFWVLRLRKFVRVVFID